MRLLFFLLLVSTVFIGVSDVSPVLATTFPNPIGHSTVSELVQAILTNLRSVMVGIVLVFVVIGAVMYVLSMGNEKKMESAKSTITAALIGLAIILAAPSFLQEIIKILGGSSGLATDSISGSLTIDQIVKNVLSFLLGVVGILSMISLILGGAFYLTAYGDEKRADMGKKIITASIIGIVVALGALTLVSQIVSFF